MKSTNTKRKSIKIVRRLKYNDISIIAANKEDTNLLRKKTK